MSALRAITSVRAAGLRPVSSAVARQAPIAAAQTRTAHGFGSSRPDDLGGPGGQEDPFRRVDQNRRFALISGGVVLAVVAATWMMTGKPADSAKDQFGRTPGAGTPTGSLGEMSGRKSDRGGGAFRSE